jgi:hypothetical protein
VRNGEWSIGGGPRSRCPGATSRWCCSQGRTPLSFATRLANAGSPSGGREGRRLSGWWERWDGSRASSQDERNDYSEDEHEQQKDSAREEATARGWENRLHAHKTVACESSSQELLRCPGGLARTRLREDLLCASEPVLFDHDFAWSSSGQPVHGANAHVCGPVVAVDFLRCEGMRTAAPLPPRSEQR